MVTSSVDVTQARRFAQDLANLPTEAIPDARAVLQKGALNIKKDWQKRWTGLANAPALAGAVTYDTRVTMRGIVAEIGPEKDRRQGALGNLLEFGSVNNAPHPGGGPALAAEEPRFVAALEKVIPEALGQ